MSVPISSVGLTTTERVILGRRVADALPEEVERLGASRVFVLCSRSLNRNTDEIEQVRRALGSKLVGVYDGMPPHAPRSCSTRPARRRGRSSCR